MVINIRNEGQPRKLSEIQSDASRVASRVTRLGARLFLGGALGAVRVVFSHDTISGWLSKAIFGVQAGGDRKGLVLCCGCLK